MSADLEAEYLATVSILKVALDYLVRLPPHPMTRSLANQIQTHLDEPSRRVDLERRMRARPNSTGATSPQRVCRSSVQCWSTERS